MLAHPVAPVSTEHVIEFMNLPKETFSWDHIFETADVLTKEGHTFNVLEPRSDFYTKPAWQY